VNGKPHYAEHYLAHIYCSIFACAKANLAGQNRKIFSTGDCD